MSDRIRFQRALDTAAPSVVAATIVAAAAGSSAQLQISRVGAPARWVLISILFGLAAARAWSCDREWRFPGSTALALGAFCGLSLVSAAWSVNARGTLERAGVGSVVVVAVVLLAGCVASRPELAERLLDGIVAAAVVVAAAGFVYWLVAPSRAAIAATVQYPSRYQGIEQNPDTAPLLLAIAMPIALWRGFGARSRGGRAFFAVALVAFAATITATGSRGGLLGGFLALLVIAVLGPRRPRARVLCAALVVAGLVVCAWATTVPKALPASQAPAKALPTTRDAELVLPLSDEIGNPWWTHRGSGIHRSLFDASVRARALRGAVSRALERPTLGFGFGAEKWAFINRYYGFSSQNPEDGYAGILLQLGFVGLALWLVVLVRCIWPGVRACVRRGRRHPFVVSAVGAAVAALAMGLSQSYFHGPGGIGYVALWTSLLLASSAGVTASS